MRLVQADEGMYGVEHKNKYIVANREQPDKMPKEK